MPMAIDCVSPKPFVGEWQPEQLLSLFSPVTVSKKSSRPSVGELAIDSAAESRLQCGLDPAGEAVSCEHGLQFVIQETALATGVQDLHKQPRHSGNH